MGVSKESTVHAHRFHRSRGHVQVKMAEKENEDPSNEPPKSAKEFLYPYPRTGLALRLTMLSFKKQ